MPGLQVDVDLLQEFERSLDPRHPERSRIPARILGYGEISTVFEIQVEGMRGLAVKRLPLFHTVGEMEKYQSAYDEYNRLLEEMIGLHIPPHGRVTVSSDGGRPTLYIVQQQLPSASIGNRALHLLPRVEVLTLVRLVLRELHRVWDFNRRQERVEVAIDGQLSNWSIGGFDPANPRLGKGAPLLYVDTSTPLFRVDGVEQLNPELFLRSAPSFLVWLIRLLFLKDVMTRYYSLRLVAIDLIANLYKEQRPDLIPAVIEVVNDFFATEAPDVRVGPLEDREIRAYYREDALIWSFYLSMRKIDRFVRSRLLRKQYPYILPEAIKR